MPTDTVAVVTGASRGIGKSAALALAQEGYRTVLVARSEDALKAVADEIRVSGAKAPLVMPTDIANPDAIRNEDILPDVAIPTDDGPGHHVAKVPNFGANANLGAIVDVAGRVNVVVGHSFPQGSVERTLVE